MARDGMVNLITRVRELTQAGTEDFTLDGVSYFGENHLQDILDQHATFLHNQPLRWLKETITGGTVVFHTCLIEPWRDFEEATSGTTHWIVRDGIGNEVGTANYSVDYLQGRVRFAANQGGTAYYLTARSYDVYGAAADIWQRKAAYYADWYSISSDQQRFERQQAYEHAVQQEAAMRARAGQNKGRGSLRGSMMHRTDLSGDWT